MRHLRYILATVFVATAALVGYRLMPRPKAATPPTPPLVDTLTGVFEQLHQATLAGDQKRFFEVLDPKEAGDLKQSVKRYGYQSLKSYIERQFANWPNLDTLSLYEVKREGSYARLTYSGPGTRFGYKEPRIRFTYLLFRQVKGVWRIAAVTDKECDKYDPYGYGYRLSFHETDLPPKLRFPRAF